MATLRQIEFGNPVSFSGTIRVVEEPPVLLRAVIGKKTRVRN
jgi:hypothetical protein